MKRITSLLLIVATITLSGCASSATSISPTSEDLNSEIIALSSATTSVESTSIISTTSIAILSSELSTSVSEVVSSSSLNEAAILFPTITIVSNAPNYYTSISDSLTGTSLKNALNSLISSGVSTSYAWSRFQSADQSLNDTSKVLTIYARYEYSKTATVGSAAAPNQWNREHTYPDSKITGAAESDNHHIFADDWKTNSIRGNKPFGLVQHLDANRVIDSGGRHTANYSNNTFFEPNDAAKGEVARATMYMNTMYGYPLEGNFQTAELAVLWALNYPVDDWAMIRNNRVYTNQHNRNPYIDNQAFICKVYGNTTAKTTQMCANYL